MNLFATVPYNIEPVCHLYGTCQGGGYIASIVDSMQADVYAVRAAAAKKRKQAEEPDEEDDE
jgi:hypothetical protein